MDPYDNNFLAYLLLRADPFFEKIPSQRQWEYVKQPLLLGRQTAQKYQAYSAAELCSHLQVKVIENDHLKTSLRGTLRLTKPQPTITIYQKNLVLLAATTGLKRDHLREIILLHELFHLLDSQQGLLDQRLEKVCTFSLLGFKRWAAIRQSEEIAAHAFAKEHAGLAQLPNHWDLDWQRPEIKQAWQAYQCLLRK